MKIIYCVGLSVREHKTEDINKDELCDDEDNANALSLMAAQPTA